jgi:23S rRNA pseudouridine1911/1915/1917 synthase
VDAGIELKQAEMVPDMVGWRLDRALATALPILSRERLKSLISAGAVTLGGRVVRDPASKVTGPAQVEVAVPLPAKAGNEAQDIPLDVVFEDEHLIVVDKPAGAAISTAHWSTPCSTIAGARFPASAGSSGRASSIGSTRIRPA